MKPRKKKKKTLEKQNKMKTSVPSVGEKENKKKKEEKAHTF